MKRNELEHIIRAAGAIADVQRIIIFGSQSILAQFPHFAESAVKNDDKRILFQVNDREILFRSIEADVLIPDSPEKTELVEAAIGELSLFHETFGYYVQGVDLSTSKLPTGWEDRLLEICNENTNWITGQCLEVHDLIISKLYAGRKKDIEFFKAVIHLGLLSKETLSARLIQTEISEDRKNLIEKYIEKGFAK